jgi:hypothetical protein
MKIHNYQLETLASYLHSLNLERKASRLRTRFKNVILERFQTVLNEVNEINKEYLMFDENNQPLLKDDKYLFRDDVKRLNDINELYKETFIVEQNENNREMLESVKDSVINHSPEAFEGKDADIYDLMCELVEQIDYE